MEIAATATFTVASYQTPSKLFFIMSQTPKTKQSHMSCITKQSHISCVLNKNTAAEGRHLDVPKTCAPGCRTTVHETIVPDTGQL